MRLDEDTWLHTGIARDPHARRQVLLRHLARRLSRPEESIALARDSFGKPILADPDSGYWFNCSSCGDLMLIAGSSNGPVGVDVETVERCRPVWEDASREFAPAERALLAGLPPSIRPLAFARLWTAKEAALKASGTGIVNGLAEPDLSVLTDLAAPSPWPAITVKVGRDRHAVTWYMVPMDEIMVIAARADTSSKPGIS
jgi:4'-phosphopantetheinyl transferase